MKRGRMLAAAVAVWAAWGLGAFPKGAEPEQRQLVTVLAFDRGARVTALTGVRATEAEEAEVLTGVGASAAEACGALRGVSSRKPYLGQVEQVLVGEGENVGAVLELILRDRELSLATLLYIVKGNAGAALSADAPRVAREIGGAEPRGVSAGQVLSALCEGEWAAVPTLRQRDGAGLTPDGWALLKGDGTVRYLVGDAALGVELMLGVAEGRTVALAGGAAELTAVSAWIGENRVSVTITARSLAGDPTAAELEHWGEVCLREALAGIGGERGTVTVTGRLVDRGGRL